MKGFRVRVGLLISGQGRRQLVTLPLSLTLALTLALTLTLTVAPNRDPSPSPSPTVTEMLKAQWYYPVTTVGAAYRTLDHSRAVYIPGSLARRWKHRGLCTTVRLCLYICMCLGIL